MFKGILPSCPFLLPEKAKCHLYTSFMEMKGRDVVNKELQRLREHLLPLWFSRQPKEWCMIGQEDCQHSCREQEYAFSGL